MKKIKTEMGKSCFGFLTKFSTRMEMYCYYCFVKKDSYNTDY